MQSATATTTIEALPSIRINNSIDEEELMNVTSSSGCELLDTSLELEQTHYLSPNNALLQPRRLRFGSNMDLSDEEDIIHSLINRSGKLKIFIFISNVYLYGYSISFMISFCADVVA